MQWSRFFNDYYNSQKVTALIRNDDSQVVDFKVDFAGMAPSPVKRPIGKGRAEMIADGVLRNLGITNARLVSTRLTVVQPNAWFSLNKSERSVNRIGTETNIAWDCFYSDSGDSSGDLLWNVWIDAKTGASLGGDSAVFSD